MVLIFGNSYTLEDCVSGEMADAHGSGPCTRKGVGVQIPSRAQQETLASTSLGLFKGADLPSLKTQKVIKNDNNMANDLLRSRQGYFNFRILMS